MLNYAQKKTLGIPLNARTWKEDFGNGLGTMICYENDIEKGCMTPSGSYRSRHLKVAITREVLDAALRARRD